MRGDVVFRIYGCHEGREEDSSLGTYRNEEEARAEIAKLQAREMNGKNWWAAQYHNKGFVVRSVVVETDFEVPSLPKPRDAYAVKTTKLNGEHFIKRDERATHSWNPPWKDLERSTTTRSEAPGFIRVARSEGVVRIGFDVELEFDLES